MANAPSYDFYTSVYGGTADRGQFDSVLPSAGATLRHITGRRPGDVPDRCADDWMCAMCAVVDCRLGIGWSGTVASETVGGTTVSYSQAAQSSLEEAEYRAVLPWLSGTGLLCQAL